MGNILAIIGFLLWFIAGVGCGKAHQKYRMQTRMNSNDDPMNFMAWFCTKYFIFSFVLILLFTFGLSYSVWIFLKA